MKKEDIIGGLFAIMVVVIVVVIFGGTYWSSPSYDKECLKEYANDYCEENNMIFKIPSKYSVSDFNVGFYCKLDLEPNLRETKKEYVEKYYYFLDEEKESCKTKEKYTFRK